MSSNTLDETSHAKRDFRYTDMYCTKADEASNKIPHIQGDIAQRKEAHGGIHSRANSAYRAIGFWGQALVDWLDRGG